MAIDLKKARDFVYSNSVLWERALFGLLFEGRSAAHLAKCLLAYKNSDNGFGNGLEPDIKTPDSHPLALESVLGSLVRDTGVAFDPQVKAIFEGTPAWLEKQRKPDGSLNNPSSTREYPHAPWWAESGGQMMPDSITGNLMALGLCTPALAESTRHWVAEYLTLETIRGTEWMFMNYHAYDYYMNVPDFPDVEAYRQAVVENIAKRAESIPEKQYFCLLQFAPSPESRVARAAPDLVARSVDYLASTQRADGGWDDEHGLAHWQPYVTIINLVALRRFGHKF